MTRLRILPGDHQLDMIVAETYGEEEESILETAKLWTHNISAYIGPQESCVHEARMAAAFKLPMISYVSGSSILFAAPSDALDWYTPSRALATMTAINFSECNLGSGNNSLVFIEKRENRKLKTRAYPFVCIVAFIIPACVHSQMVRFPFFNTIDILI